ncbi:hypothetical protein TVAG_211990 [Trichomonas vaginalis G3]|uniref:Uncharacterized protein n=1 Tax=Trichomonas vaginalis (strain ATCC PRA-98 / G3) TaxID=412133 RepID=A2EIF5_TRIV3|nr:hypothetical protein TVAGG3_0049110 [Trichomonas vaginalis G3]EAY07560.1 hypothetical protein TVAG_211990 [Trichomonas vaginalis G3]KAI5541267.1 hypothetical protein TVAGG3_0049110 [Trichomonas vaginalis G3]|eukprot:XP_001319783.1 hypothetical protein [Trichomonas vaginalis G3]
MEMKNPYYGLWLISFLIQSDERALQTFVEDMFIIGQVFDAHLEEPLIAKDCRCSIIFYISTLLSQNQHIQDIKKYAQFIVSHYENMNTQFKVVSIYFVTTMLSRCQFSELQELDFDQLFEILSEIIILQNYLKFKSSDFELIIKQIKANTAGWPININDLLENNDIISQLECLSDDES